MGALALLSALACTDPGDPGDPKDSVPATDSAPVTDACPGDPAVEIGTGDREFISIEDGDQLPLIHGPQGGNHILGAIRLWNIDPIVLIRYTLTRLDNAFLYSDNTYRLQVVPEAECQWYYLNLYGYIGFAGEGTGSQDIVMDVMWYEAEMRMEVVDQAGVTLVDTRRITPIPEDPPE